MKEKNTSHLAGEFLVAGELARRGYSVSITMGNAKSVDIYAEKDKKRFKVDAKASRTKTNWPVNEKSIQPDVFYVFVNLGTDSQIEDNISSEYFIVTGKEIKSKNLIQSWKSRQGITYKSLNDEKYIKRWDKFQTDK
jgi:hypothetical protein